MKPVIELKDVSRSYIVGTEAVHALSSVSLTIERGEFVSIMGPSGSGKSTLMNLIGALDTPTSGIVKIDGYPTAKMNEKELALLRNQKIGFVYQQFNLLASLSARENVATPLLYAGVGARERKQSAEKLLRFVGLEKRMKHRPSELSGGQKQRVAIARALVTNPAIILADEPTGALDSKTGEQIMDIFTRLHEEGHTVVLVTHDQKLGERCPRVIRILDGRVVS